MLLIVDHQHPRSALCHRYLPAQSYAGTGSKPVLPQFGGNAKA